jgi:hypothetical protein
MTWEEIDNAFDELEKAIMPDFIDGLVHKYFGVYMIDMSKVPNDMTPLQVIRLFQQTGIMFCKGN